MASSTSTRVDLDGNPINSITICMIGAGGFIGSLLCDKLMHETPQKVLALDVYNDKINISWNQAISHGMIEYNSIASMSNKIRDLKVSSKWQVKYCSENNKRLIHFSTCEVYGKTIGSFLPKDSPLRQDPAYYVLKEDESPCILVPLKSRDGLMPNLLRGELLKLVDCGQSQRTFVYIQDTIEAVLSLIVYSKVSGEPSLESPTIDISSKQFYGEGYDDSDKRIPDMNIINKHLGSNPKTSLWDLC
ncbi:hypothetical protein TanjilG_16263 [Lupinus angustifolius]|uniref:Uncharacterized protein n=1 Tax=Lupinus angustifolius TaxID=3871 RepID=A0A1J7H8W1_LUPAN|nr:hypothetical protein TanjilG_16263 [Lupinus angustifolius]